MKRIAVFLALVFVILLVFPSCEKETLLTVDQTSISFTDAGGSQTVTLTANKPWSVSSTQSWCKVSPSGGEEAAGSRISISCDANTTYDARTCTVTFTCAEMTKSVTVSQATNNGLQVSQTTYEVTKAAQQLNIEVKANVKFSVEVDNSCKDWVKYNTTKALTTSTVVLDIAENKTYDSREGKVTIKQDGGSLSSTITIKQSQLDGLFLTTSEYNLSNEKHTLTVEVSTNVELEVKPEADWVKYVQTKGLSTKQIVLEVAENNTYDQRETKVNVKQKNGDLSGTITIKQDEKYGILVSQSEYNLTNEAQTIEVEVKYNVDFEVSIPDGCKEWIKQVTTKGLSTKNYTFSIAKNETYDNREGSITFKQKDGLLSATIQVNQAQTDYLDVEKYEFEIDIKGGIIDIAVKANVDYTISIGQNSYYWLTRVETKGLIKDTVSIAVSSGYDDETDRIGEIVFTYGDMIKTVKIHQYSFASKKLVQFDDEIFKSYCVSRFDTNGDGEISIKETRNVKEIRVYTNFITSLKGIECFEELERLYCGIEWNSGRMTADGIWHLYRNGDEVIGQLKSLDISQNTALKSLECLGNQLTSLDVSKNTVLEKLVCSFNYLTELDVSTNIALKQLECMYNKLSELNLSNNTELTHLNLGENQLKSLDVSNNTGLIQLKCEGNRLNKLDISNNTLLKQLWGDTNQITELDVSNNLEMTVLYCHNNQISSLDVSKNTALTELICDNNPLSSLDVRNNTELTRLDCIDNNLSSLDVTSCAKLTVLACRSNKITSLDLSKASSLSSLFCENNLLSSLDVTNCPSLNLLWCQMNPYLKEIRLSKNQTISDLKYDTKVAFLYYVDGSVIFKDANFKAYCVHNFDIDGDGEISSEEALTVMTIQCDNSEITSLEGVEYFKNLKNLYCGRNQLSIINVSNNTELTVLSCEGNQLTTLDVGNNTCLLNLNCSDNQIVRLNLNSNKNLTELNSSNNQLTRLLDVSENTELVLLDCRKNPRLSEIWLKTNQTIPDFWHDPTVTIKYKD